MSEKNTEVEEKPIDLQNNTSNVIEIEELERHKKFFRLFFHTKKLLEKVLNKCTLIIGDSRVGRSTLYYYIKDEKLIGIKKEFRTVYCLAENSEKTEAFKYTESIISSLHNFNEESLIDFAGFHNYYNIEEQFLRTYFLEELFRRNKLTRFIFVFHENDLESIKFFDQLIKFIDMIHPISKEKRESYYNQEKEEEEAEFNTFNVIFKKLFHSVSIVVNQAQYDIGYYLKALEYFKAMTENINLNIPYRYVIRELIHNMILHKRIIIFSKAKENISPPKCEILQSLQREEYSWQHINLTNEEEIFIFNKFKRNKRDMCHEQRNFLEEMTNKGFEIINNSVIFVKKMINKMLTNLFLEKQSYQPELEALKEFVDNNNYNNFEFTSNNIKGYPLKNIKLIETCQNIFNLSASIRQKNYLESNENYIEGEIRLKYKKILNILKKFLTFSPESCNYFEILEKIIDETIEKTLKFDHQQEFQSYFFDVLLNISDGIFYHKELEFVFNELYHNASSFSITELYIKSLTPESMKRLFTDKEDCLEFNALLSKLEVNPESLFIYEKQISMKMILAELLERENDFTNSIYYTIEAFSLSLMYGRMISEEDSARRDYLAEMQRTILNNILSYCRRFNYVTQGIQVAIYMDEPSLVCKLIIAYIASDKTNDDREEVMALLGKFADYCQSKGRVEMVVLIYREMLEMERNENERRAIEKKLAECYENGFRELSTIEASRKKIFSERDVEIIHSRFFGLKEKLSEIYFKEFTLSEDNTVIIEVEQIIIE